MNILDENISSDQRDRLRIWRVPIRQIGYDVGHEGLQDEEIIPLLNRLHRPTFFSRDWDFYERRLCHARFCLVYLSVEKDKVAIFVRRLLRHPAFDSETKRMGKVIRASDSGLSYWQLRLDQEQRIAWAK